MTTATEHMPTANAFASRRKAWLEREVSELAAVLRDTCPALYEALPRSIGDFPTLVATVVVRVAADDADARPVEETAHLLERLLPEATGVDLTEQIMFLRSSLTLSEAVGVRSWRARDWADLLSERWYRQITEAQGARAAEHWAARWNGTQPTSPASAPELAPTRFGRELVTLDAFFTREPDPVRLLAHAVLTDPGTTEAVADSVLLRSGYLRDAGHLVWLAEQQAYADRLEVWRTAQHAIGSEAIRGFLAELSPVIKKYMSVVLQPTVDALSPAERRLWRESGRAADRNADAYLDAFLDCLPEQGPEDFRDGSLNATVLSEAAQNRLRGVRTWHGMRGSTPVWYHVVASPQERAAALAYSGKPTASVIQVSTGLEDAPGPPVDLFGRPTTQHDEWYPEPGIRVEYAPDRAFDLGALLVLGSLGHARLDFLEAAPDGGFTLLRTVRARLRPEDAAHWRRQALGTLDALIGDPAYLAEAVLGEETGEDDDLADQDTPADGTPAGPAGQGLPPDLLKKVRALLTKAEDPAATEEEARTYLGKATELMAKYGIEQAMLEGHSEPALPVDRVVPLRPPYAKETSTLLGWIAHAMRCSVVHLHSRRRGYRVHLFGFEADVQAAELLFASLRLQMLDGAARADRLHRPDTEDARAYKRSWMYGFMREVTRRVQAAQDAMRTEAEHARVEPAEQRDGRSVELVLADRTQVVEARLTATYPKLGKARRIRFSGSGFGQGVTDGRIADIGGPSVTSDGSRPPLSRALG
ncbi:DUF2786 domain-containing protein [Streptomyces sp. NPDC000229]|uniref:DUF2786 domain-containing protein n=1 Tax=Streptomyces sp. NPDC000229 TaxID=3154247 RepID=UPI00332CD3B5